MNVLFLAAGASVRGSAEAYPAYLAEIRGRTVLELIHLGVAPLRPRKCIFAVHRDDIERFHMDDVVRLLGPEAAVLRVAGETQGAACTALLAVRDIDTDDELVIANVTDLIRADLARTVGQFRRSGADAGTIVFDSLHPRYSFVRQDATGRVVEAAERRPISRHATAGFYWFRRGGDFVRAAKAMILKDAQVDGMYFVCPTLNELILEGRTVLAAEVSADCYVPLKTAALVEEFRQTVERRLPADAAGHWPFAPIRDGIMPG